MDISQMFMIRSVKLQSANVHGMSEVSKEERDILRANDEVKWENTSEYIALNFIRKIRGEKDTEFCIDVDIRIECDIIDDGAYDDNNKKAIEKRLLNKAASEASMIIAQLSKYMAIGPLISAPMYIKRTD